MTSMCLIELTKNATKDLEKVPFYIKEKLLLWVNTVQRVGINQTRKLSGFHDEPLKGVRKGQRSIRLSRSYRAIYIETHPGKLHLISVIEVNKHAY